MTLGPGGFDDMAPRCITGARWFAARASFITAKEAVANRVIKAMRPQHRLVCSTTADPSMPLVAACRPVSVRSELFASHRLQQGRGGFHAPVFSREHHLLGGYAFIGEGIPVLFGAAFTSRYKRDGLGMPSSDSSTAAFFR